VLAAGSSLPASSSVTGKTVPGGEQSVAGVNHVVKEMVSASIAGTIALWQNLPELDLYDHVEMPIAP
jgi:hypothetical protein